MLDLTRILSDLESPTYGALSHTIEVLKRVVRADGAVALCHDTSTRQETVYVSVQDDTTSPQWYNRLRQWPGDPLSGFWLAHWNVHEDSARLCKPSDPTDAPWCREVALMLSAPEVAEQARCLCLTLASSPQCRVLFVRLGASPPFNEQDAERVLRFAAPCGHIIRNGRLRELDQHRQRPMSLRFSGSTEHPSQANLLDQLNSLERQVLQRLRLNETEKQIALSLSQSLSTIHVHVESIYSKLRVSNRKQLVLMLEILESHPQPVDVPFTQSRSA